jgi:hypothetical protein
MVCRHTHIAGEAVGVCVGCYLPPKGGMIAPGNKAYGSGVLLHLAMLHRYFRIAKIAKASCGLSQDAFGNGGFRFPPLVLAFLEMQIYEVLSSTGGAAFACF